MEKTLKTTGLEGYSLDYITATPNSVSTSTWLCVTCHLTWKALHTKRDKHQFYFWNLSKYKT